MKQVLSFPNTQLPQRLSRWHASPLSSLGGADSGGQNVYVAQIARHLARHGDQIDVFTRRDDPSLPENVESAGCRVIHVPAGPAESIRKEAMLE